MRKHTSPKTAGRGNEGLGESLNMKNMTAPQKWTLPLLMQRLARFKTNSLAPRSTGHLGDRASEKM